MNNPAHQRDSAAIVLEDGNQTAEEKAAAPKAVASSSTDGFFQSRPRLQNAMEDDIALQRCIAMYLPPDVQLGVCPDLHRFANLVLSPATFRNMTDSERNLPYVQQFDTFGRRVDRLVTSEGWRASTATSHREGLVAIGYDKSFGQYARVYQFLKTHIWSPAACCVTCPSAMHDGATSLLLKHVSPDSPTPETTKQVLRSALAKLLSRDPDETWTSGQWMTERPGGSDVRNTETRATFTPDFPSTMPLAASDGSPLGPWSISGFKWFSSATDAGMAVMLAKMGDTDQISAFFAPTKLIRTSTPTTSPPVVESNGIAIQRLKSKLGTKPVPTAELVLSGVRAHLIGQVGQGTKEISSILNITRVHSTISGISGLGRALAIARTYSLVRKTNGRLLADVPAHVKSLANITVDYRAHMLITFFAISLLGVSEHASKIKTPSHASAAVPTDDSAVPLLRLFTPILKAISCLTAVAGIRACMESLGGVGYLEGDDPDLNIAVLLRDANVQPIWEGTTDVLGSDCVRVLKGKSGSGVLAALGSWIKGFEGRFSSYAGAVKDQQQTLTTIVSCFKTLEAAIASSSSEYLLYRSREIMEGLSWLACTVLLFEDAMRDGDAVSFEIARRWMQKRRGMFFADQVDSFESEKTNSWIEAVQWDGKVVFGYSREALIARL